MLWFINNVVDIKKQLAEAQATISAQAAIITDLQARVTALDGGPPAPPPSPSH